jgi:hypothetical protein
MKIINRNTAKNIKRHFWIITNYGRIRKNQKKNGFILKDVAIIFALSKDQISNLIKCIRNSDFNEKFPVTSLRNKKVFIIQSNEYQIINFHNKTIIKVGYPEEFLLLRKWNQMGWKKKKKGVFSTIDFRRHKYSSILENFKFYLLNEINNLDIYTTISTLGNLGQVFQYPKKLRNYKTNMIYYAEPMSITRHDSGQIYFEYEFYKNVNLCDIHWVWTSDFAGSLAKKNNEIIVKPVGSIVFKLKDKIKIDNKRNQIVIFDVSPQKHVKKNTFYQMDLITKFFEDIIIVKKDLEKIWDFDLILKPKRALGINHLGSYREMLNRFQKNSDLKIVDWDVNPYSLIAESIMTISIPCTSIAIIGKEVGTTSIYYYPFSNPLQFPNSNLQVPLIYGVSELHRCIQDNLCQNWQSSNNPS